VIAIDATEAASCAVDAALRAGADGAEAYVQQGLHRHVGVHAGATDFVKESRVRGLGLRVVANGRRGFVHSSDLRGSGLTSLAQRAVRLALLAPEDPWAALPSSGFAQPGGEDLDLFDAGVAALTVQDLLQRAGAMEQAALGANERVRRTRMCSAQTYAETRALVNSRGPALEYASSLLSSYVGALAEDADGRQQGWYEGGTWRHESDATDPHLLGREAGRQAVRRLGPRRVETQRVPVIMHPNVVSDWLDNLAGAFSGDAVRRKTSWLAERLGDTLASPSVSIVDDARRQRGVGSAPFDAEGIMTQRTALIDRGVCGAFLYDDGSARRAAARSTGSADRDYDTPPRVGTHNLYLATGDARLQELLDVRRGFYYLDSGSFGYNSTTGDYAFQAAGFWLENGALAFPVDEITVASNSLDMLRNIDAIGSDIDWRAATCAPAIRIAEMTVGA
jgi:PmbA protein